jgi:F0F1-type ATP synthase membrane subunit b/b'
MDAIIDGNFNPIIDQIKDQRDKVKLKLRDYEEDVNKKYDKIEDNYKKDVEEKYDKIEEQGDKMKLDLENYKENIKEEVKETINKIKENYDEI